MFSLKSIVLSLTALLASQAAAIPHELSSRAADNECVPQGAGSCNFVLWASVDANGDGGVYWTGATIYDNACNSIGGVFYPTQGEAIDSQLPYTVVIERLVYSGDFQSIGMCYAAYCYQGDFACSQTGSIISCAHGFPC
ncbi:hypothetical protein F5884DRAFT_798306 [Xylogone sp. PMI_703]|nr:hypothetical protein F5884DRAFT_798306 [Xylogone sp. PMI_703]